MAWYVVAFFVGLAVGLIVEDLISTETKVSYKGKIKQRGTGNMIFLKKENKEGESIGLIQKLKKRRKKRKLKRKQKRNS